MASALAQVHEPALKDFEARYQEGRKELKETNEQLDLIRDLKGKVHSYELEKEEVLEKLGTEKSEMFSSLQLPFIEADKIQINEFLSRVADELRDLIDHRRQLIVQLKAILADPDEKHEARLRAHTGSLRVVSPSSNERLGVPRAGDACGARPVLTAESVRPQLRTGGLLPTKMMFRQR
jgi:hypothetical protein